MVSITNKNVSEIPSIRLQKMRIKLFDPGYPRSNGLAEKAVHISKQLLKKCHSEKVDLETAQLEYRYTPIVELNASPSELLMSRLLKTKLPISKDKSRHTLLRNNQANLKRAHGKYKEWHDKRNNKKEVIFYEGHKAVVFKKHKWIPGKIISKIDSPRSYWVELLELNESEEEGNVESKNIEGSEPQKYKLQESKVVPMTTRSELPIEKIAADITSYNLSNYIVVVDYWSKWQEISPGYPRSNGLAEKAVHISKQLLKKCHSEKVDLETAQLEYRYTPIVELNASPSELLMSRLLKTKLPISKDKSRHTLLRNNQANLKRAHGKYKEWHDKRNNKKEVIFYEGHKAVVFKKHKWIPGKIISKIDSPRSYWVELLELNESEEEGNVESKNIEGSEPQKYKLQESKVVPMTTRSELPIEKIAADITSYNLSNYIVVVDYWSKWQEISPGYPRSNGLAEKAVHISKQLLKKCHSEKVDLETAQLEYRYTPIVELNASPSELLMSRLLKTKLPISKDKSRHTLLRNNQANLKRAHGKYKEWHDKRNNKKEVIFYEGHKAVVFKKHKWIPGKIISKIDSPRSYWVELLELNESEEEGNVESKNIEGSEPQKYKLQESKVVPMTTRSELPIEKIAADITSYNLSNYIVVVDYWSKWQEISPGYPRSNGLAEKAVHISKQLLKKCHSEKVDLETAQLEYRYTPIVELNASPSELLMSRLLKTKLPISKDKSRHTLLRNNQANLKRAHGKYKEWHDKRNNKKEVIFYEGHKAVVFKKHKWIPGKIISKIDSPRSYWVELLELNESEEEGNVESKNIEGSEPQKYKLQESKVVPMTTRSELPIEKIAADITSYNLSNYIVVVDYWSKWQEISPGYPRSNGLAEKAVHISKQLLKKCHSEKVDLETAQLEYRYTPIVELNASPSELLMSRLLKTKLPISKDKSRHTLLRNNQANLKRAHGKYKEWHDKRNNKKEVIFYEGHKAVVFKKHKWIPGKIISKIDSPRSYWVELLELNESEEEGNVESKNIEGSEPQKYKLQESKVVPMTTRS
ncbi:hypothetical protein QTP88_029970, partial [Uroleucon formosanum]